MIAQDAKKQSQHQPKLTQPNQEVPHTNPVLTQQHPQLQTSPSAACMEEQFCKQQQSHSSAEAATATASQPAHTPTHIALSQHAQTLHRTDVTDNAAACMHGTKRSAADMEADNASGDVSHKRKQQGQSMSHSAKPTLPGQEWLGVSHSTQLAGQQGQESFHSTQLALQARQRQKPAIGTTPAGTAQRQEQIHGTDPTVLTQQPPESSHDTQPALPEIQHPSQQDLPLVPSPSSQQEDDEEEEEEEEVDGSCLNDTVGAIFIDASGNYRRTNRLCLFASCTRQKGPLHLICPKLAFPL